jgi:glutamine amidotransferase
VSLDLVLTTPTDVWAFRYPLENGLFILSPGPGELATAGLPACGTHLAATAGELAARTAVVIASERMDADPGRRLLASGELLRIDSDFSVTQARSSSPESARDDLRPYSRERLCAHTRVMFTHTDGVRS